MIPLLLSCKFKKQQTQCISTTASATTANRNGSSNQNGLGDESGLMDSVDRQKFRSCVGQLRLINSICSLIIFCLLIQSGGAQPARHESPVGKPCICNSTFYQVCPPVSECMENYPLDQLKQPPKLSYDPRDFDDYGDYLNDYSSGDSFHDDYDPDHVSDPYEIDPLFNSRPIANRPNDYLFPTLPLLNSNQPNPIETHRKVYVEAKPPEDVPIHSLKIRVPLKVPEITKPAIPDPLPLFKYKKYTTYESKPEIYMVPITKTIIKPVGVRPEQIINGRETSQKMR